MASGAVDQTVEEDAGEHGRNEPQCLDRGDAQAGERWPRAVAGKPPADAEQCRTAEQPPIARWW